MLGFQYIYNHKNINQNYINTYMSRIMTCNMHCAINYYKMAVHICMYLRKSINYSASTISDVWLKKN